MSILRKFTWSPNAWCLFYVNLRGLLTLIVKNRIWNTQGRELLSASTQCSKRVVSGVHRDKNCFPLVHTVVSVVKSRIWSTQGQELLSASTHCSKRTVSGVHRDKSCYPPVHSVVKNLYSVVQSSYIGCWARGVRIIVKAQAIIVKNGSAKGVEYERLIWGHFCKGT